MEKIFTITYQNKKYQFTIHPLGYVSPLTGEIIDFTPNPQVVLTLHIAKYI